jgi:hypothetical protein
MKKIALVVFILAIIRMTAISQSCLPLGITFHTQAEIDSFQVNYPGCTVIEGDVFIGDYVAGGSIKNLNGLMAVDSMLGRLIIQHNDSLASLAGLGNLVYLGNQLGIWYNPLLTDLTGLEGLTEVPHLNVGYSDNLTSFAGLGNLVSTGGLYIENNPLITSLAGLEGLNSVDGYVSIVDNDALLSLDGLDNLVIIGGGLSIEFNNALENILALKNVITLNNDGEWSGLSLKSNISLTSLHGLDNIDPQSISELSIGWNASLSECDVISICQYLADPNGYVAIRYNAPGCNNQEEVLEDCADNCLPDGITFYTQSQVDSFQVNYPGCTEVGGDLTITGFEITDLNELSVITSIGGDLIIGNEYFNSPPLVSLDGLRNVTFIGGNIEMVYNETLTDLSGLESLAYLGGSLMLRENTALVNLSGLEGLASIGEGVEVVDNSILASLAGLDNVNSIGWYLNLNYNPYLTNLDGLGNLTSAGGLWIDDNHALTSLTGLDGLTYLTGGLYIYNNWVLPGLAGLEGLTSVGYALEIAGNHTLTDLNGLNNVTSVGENLEIRDNRGLTSLSGLESLISIGQDLNIDGNDSLASLTGLENLASVGGALAIYNNPVTSLTGLSNVNYVGGFLFIYYNNNLYDLTGLDNIDSIGDNLSIIDNSSLESLSGLDNIAPGSITDLTIRNNISLSACDVESICDYLADPNGVISIHDNAAGCNSQAEVEASCLEEVDEVVSRQSSVISYPNPSDGISYFSFHISQCQWVTIKIYDMQGRELATILDEELPAGSHEVSWNAESLPPGIYFYRISTIDHRQSAIGKIVVLR